MVIIYQTRGGHSLPIVRRGHWARIIRVAGALGLNRISTVFWQLGLYIGVIRVQCPRPVEFGFSAPAPWYSEYNSHYMERLRVYFNSSAPATCMLVNYDKFGPVPPPGVFRHSAPAPLDIREKCPRQAQKHLVSLSWVWKQMLKLFSKLVVKLDLYCCEQLKLIYTRDALYLNSISFKYI